MACLVVISSTASSIALVVISMVSRTTLSTTSLVTCSGTSTLGGAPLSERSALRSFSISLFTSSSSEYRLVASFTASSLVLKDS